MAQMQSFNRTEIPGQSSDREDEDEPDYSDVWKLFTELMNEATGEPSEIKARAKAPFESKVTGEPSHDRPKLLWSDLMLEIDSKIQERRKVALEKTKVYNLRPLPKRARRTYEIHNDPTEGLPLECNPFIFDKICPEAATLRNLKVQVPFTLEDLLKTEQSTMVMSRCVNYSLWMTAAMFKFLKLKIPEEEREDHMFQRMSSSLSRCMSHLMMEVSAMNIHSVHIRRDMALNFFPDRFTPEEKKDLLKDDVRGPLLFNDSHLRSLDETSAARVQQNAMDKVALNASHQF